MRLRVALTPMRLCPPLNTRPVAPPSGQKWRPGHSPAPNKISAAVQHGAGAMRVIGSKDVRPLDQHGQLRPAPKMRPALLTRLNGWGIKTRNWTGFLL